MFFGALGRKLKMVLVIRADLKLTKGKLGSQTAHAAVSCFQKTLDTKPKLANQWLGIGQPKIVLKIDNLTELEALRDKAESADLITTLILDAGRTHIAPGTATCIGIGPDYDEKIDAIVKDLKLL
jgi:peptidyl-tRNA hydrolase, PTH2 family